MRRQLQSCDVETLELIFCWNKATCHVKCFTSKWFIFVSMMLLIAYHLNFSILSCHTERFLPNYNFPIYLYDEYSSL